MHIYNNSALFDVGLNTWSLLLEMVLNLVGRSVR